MERNLHKVINAHKWPNKSNQDNLTSAIYFAKGVQLYVQMFKSKW
jgi:hypothetical protein